MFVDPSCGPPKAYCGKSKMSANRLCRQTLETLKFWSQLYLNPSLHDCCNTTGDRSWMTGRKRLSLFPDEPLLISGALSPIPTTRCRTTGRLVRLQVPFIEGANHSNVSFYGCCRYRHSYGHGIWAHCGDPLFEWFSKPCVLFRPKSERGVEIIHYRPRSDSR